MGKEKMKCKKCGNTNINDFVVFFIDTIPSEDATTLPKFLFELSKDNNFKKIEKIVCHKEIKGKLCLNKINPTRYGI